MRYCWECNHKMTRPGLRRQIATGEWRDMHRRCARAFDERAALSPVYVSDHSDHPGRGSAPSDDRGPKT